MKFFSTGCDPRNILAIMREMAVILACWAFVAYGYALTRPAPVETESVEFLDISPKAR